MLKIGTVKWKWRCTKHQGYDPEQDGEGGIRGGCGRCRFWPAIPNHPTPLGRALRDVGPSGAQVPQHSPHRVIRGLTHSHCLRLGPARLLKQKTITPGPRRLFKRKMLVLRQRSDILTLGYKRQATCPGEVRPSKDIPIALRTHTMMEVAHKDRKGAREG